MLVGGLEVRRPEWASARALCQLGLVVLNYWPPQGQHQPHLPSRTPHTRARTWLSEHVAGTRTHMASPVRQNLGAFVRRSCPR